LSCVKCNREKGSVIPFFDKAGKIPTPPSIPALMLNAEKIRPEWNYFLKNLW